VRVPWLPHGAPRGRESRGFGLLGCRQGSRVEGSHDVLLGVSQGGLACRVVGSRYGSRMGSRWGVSGSRKGSRWGSRKGSPACRFDGIALVPKVQKCNYFGYDFIAILISFSQGFFFALPKMHCLRLPRDTRETIETLFLNLIA
jgi:hypothetical protein